MQIEKIKERIIDLQRSHVSLQEQLKNTQNSFERHIDDSALQIIDMLDMIGMAKLNMGLQGTANSNAELIIKKIEKRIGELLRRWQVQEIIFTNARVEPGKARVLETRKTSESVPLGTIIEICRKGYQRGNKVIRPADVITAADS